MPAHARWHAGLKDQHAHEPPAAAASPAVPAPVRDRDIPGVAWWAVEQLAAGSMEGRDGGVYSTLLRVLLACGPGDEDGEEALLEVELRGRLMHGLPPAAPEQWELLAQRFSAAAVEEVRRWGALLEGDPLDVVDPAFPGDG